MIKTAFSIPFWQEQMPNFNQHRDSMIDAVYEFRDQFPEGEYKSNHAGYQSPKNLHHNQKFQSLFDFVNLVAVESARQIGLDGNIILSEAWANIHDSRQCMNHMHIHGGVFSGCFYLKVPNKSGRILFSKPGLTPMWQGLGLVKQPNQYTAESTHYLPPEGTLLLWPSYVPHGVETNDTDEARISIAFNFYRE